MARYRISGQVTISIYTDVEADSPDAAIEEAEGRAMKRLCWSCGDSRGSDEEWVTSGELDGTAQEMKCEGEVGDGE
jgi:hypothetical protein